MRNIKKSKKKIEPIAHGRWYTNDYYTACSNCGKHLNGNSTFPYCPYCGAKMDGKTVVLDGCDFNHSTDISTETILIKYFDSKIEKLQKVNCGDWIDLRSAETVDLKQGEYRLINLGVGMKLPQGYEVHIVPRSSTFKNFGIIQANSFGVIDETYCGDNDQWKFPAIALRDTTIHKNDRICQFRIEKHQLAIYFEEVERLDATDRGGFGSTGKS